jgi:beta-glucosidase
MPTTLRTAALCTLALLPSLAAWPARSADAIDARVKRTEAALNDDERVQLLHGLLALRIPLDHMEAIPPGIPATAGFVRGVPRLGIPDLLESDASLGVANPLRLRSGDTATAFASSLALAATFDIQLAEQLGVVLGNEARGKGFNVILAGGMNLTRDPRGGRNFEYLGEDPLLAGSLAGHMVAGTQSQGVISTVKHFAFNDQETLRNTVDARIDEAALRESDLLAFELAIEQGHPGAVMCSYNLLNGVHACGSDFLLNRVLKREWGYKGWVMSDWGAVHSLGDLVHGLDQESGEQMDDRVWFDAPLRAQLESDPGIRSRVADAVRRILHSMYAIGVDRPPPAAAVDFPAHATLVRSIAAAGCVLLKNDGILPLGSSARHVLVVGGHADIGVLSGGGSSQVVPTGGPAALIPVGGPGLTGPWGDQLWVPSSPLLALRRSLGGTSVEYDSGYDLESAAIRAKSADAVIVFASRWQVEGFDTASMSLPQGQDELISRMAHANPNTIVVLETGDPVAMPWLADVRAALEAWYPGQQGGEAIADVLTGAVNPGGRLPMSFPRTAADTPRPDIPGIGLPDTASIKVDYVEGADAGYRWYAAKNTQPLFPFGFGLSYATFQTTNFSVTAGSAPVASVTVRNTGPRAGAYVVQVYSIKSRAAGREQRLVAFSRVPLQPGESKEVRLPLDLRFLAHWDTAANRWRVTGGIHEFALGENARDLTLTASVALPGRLLAP